MGMTLNDYQNYARNTATYKDGISKSTYMLYESSLNVANIIRDIEDINGKISDEDKDKIIQALGDSLWYLTNAASDLGVSLEIIAQSNIDKINYKHRMEVIQAVSEDKK